MTNIQNFSLTKIVDFVPEAKIWKHQNSFRCADEIDTYAPRPPHLWPKIRAFPCPHVKTPKP
jgi:hypothetical protein